MTITIPLKLLSQIHAHGEAAYPEEGAGLLLGTVNGTEKEVRQLLPMENAREGSARANRYLLNAEDYLQGERMAEELGFEVIGVFHSHPDHPNQPSEFDREWAFPWLSYIITKVQSGNAEGSRSWLLEEDRSCFVEERVRVVADLST